MAEPTGNTSLIQAPDFSPHLGQLLRFANVEETLESLGALDDALKSAWGYNKWRSRTRDYPPAELLESLDQAIEKTKKLLRKAEKYGRSPDIAFDLCPIGEGTVSVKTQRGMMMGEPLTLLRHPPPLSSQADTFDMDGSMAAINVYRVLERLQREIGTYKRPPSRPREIKKAAIVDQAAAFFRKYSAEKLTGYPDGHFANFARAFYDAVTGKEVLDNIDALQTQIKAAAKSRDLSS